MNVGSKVKLGSSVMDSGLVVVVFIITSLIITVFSFLLFVDYEWCHVLFKNNTVMHSLKKNLLQSLIANVDKKCFYFYNLDCLKVHLCVKKNVCS